MAGRDPLPVERPSRARAALDRLTGQPTAAPLVLLAATAIALVVANTPLGHAYEGFWAYRLGFSFGGYVRDQPLKQWIDDGLMVLFFFVIGLEIKRELLVGRLSTLRRAALPAFAALGGMIAPAVIYVAINAGGPGAHGWAVPVATDIAFALGVAALVGSRLCPDMRVFLQALAIADDIGAMLVIALFYGSRISLGWLAVSAALLLVLVAFNRAHVDAAWPYVLVGVGVWFAFLNTGLHPTVSGVLIALTIPAGSQLAPLRFVGWARRKLDAIADTHVPGSHVLEEEEVRAVAAEVQEGARLTQAPLQRIEHALRPVTDLVVLPFFALANAGIPLGGAGPLKLLAQPVAIGVVLGLVAGKQVGIASFTWLAVRLGIAELPGGASWRQVYGVACLGGIGFTMSLFVTNLAFADPALAAQARIAILTASLLSALGAYAYFRFAVGEGETCGVPEGS